MTLPHGWDLEPQPPSTDPTASRVRPAPPHRASARHHLPIQRGRRGQRSGARFPGGPHGGLPQPAVVRHCAMGHPPTAADVDAVFEILPFRFLRAEARASLIPELQIHTFEAHEPILIQGQAEDDRVWLLLEGQVEILDLRGGGSRPRRVSTLDAGHYFGERRALFARPRTHSVHTTRPSIAASFPGARLRALLSHDQSFALTLGSLLRDKQGLLRHFERFLAEVRSGAGRGYIVIPRLIHLYRPLHPALHLGVRDEEIDFSALRYVVPRLPEQISEVLSLFLTSELPPQLLGAQADLERVSTAARRRTTYRMMSSKLVILLRDGWTDLIDLITCLCAYAVEARKIRQRIKDPQLVASLIQGRPCPLPFSDEERAHLEALWPGAVPSTLRAMITHHEDFAIHVLKQSDNYSSAKGERWTSQVADCARRLLGVEPHEMPEDFEVHIVSSNTHSVTNTLSSGLLEHAGVIEDWGRQAMPELFELPWPDPMDRVVALARPWAVAHPEQAQRRRERDAQPGAEHLTETGFTGIGVDLFCLQRLQQRTWDPSVPRPDGRPGLLVNIDYAFGQQAEPIITALIALFGRNIRSVSVLGKAGGLVGSRGDVLIGSSFVEQETDTLLTPTIDIDPGALAARLPDRSVRVGRVATVAGTLLQNPILLRYYQQIWQCLGLEMEGIWYAKRLMEARQLGLLRPDCEMRFLYYISDLPLAHGQSLSGSMNAFEGIPPLYAITRQVLTRVFRRP